MTPDSPRWKVITPSEYAHERIALDYVRDLLPDIEPYRAWACFEFQAGTGAIYEVDLLVLSKAGLFLVEVKSWPGRVSGDAATWKHRWPDGKTRSLDNPVPLANRKAKHLRSLLVRQPELRGVDLPFLQPLVFLSAEDLRFELRAAGASRVVLRDAEGRPGIRRALGCAAGKILTSA